MVSNTLHPERHTGAAELSILRCPDCSGKLSLECVCFDCGREFNCQDNYLELLPLDLHDVKRGENSVFAEDSEELQKFQKRIWRKIVGRLEVERFDQEIAPTLPKGRFLELAGESCWASAIYKSANPDSTVYATDVAPTAIRNIAMPLAQMFPVQPDYFAAVDAEHLPFEDETFDCVFIESAMHHLPDLVRMLREAKRVLRDGGTFVAVDHVVPTHFRFLFEKTADRRSEDYGIQEALLSYADWERAFKDAGYPASCLHAYTSTRYIRNPFFAIAGNLAAVLPDVINRRLFPVGLYVWYVKTGS